MTYPKVPQRPVTPLRRRSGDVIRFQQPVWRIHRTQGEHVIGWNQFRTYGPIASARYDPHPDPVGDHPGDGISYTATDLETPLAEVFQSSRRVDTVTGAPYATSWTPTRPMQLLDLTGDWALRNGAAHSLAYANRPICRAWSRTIHQTWDDIDGLWAPSTMTGSAMVVMYQRAASSMPPRPAFSQPLAAPVTWSVAATIAASIGYAIR